MSRSKRAPFLAIRTDIVKDESFSVLADVGGYSRDEALGRMIRLWAFCRDRVLEDAPDDCDGYAVSEAVIRRFLGPRGVEAILGEGCAAFALGSVFRDGLIFLRGTSDDVGRLRDLHRTRSAGGQARAAGDRDDTGRWLPAGVNVGDLTKPDSATHPEQSHPDLLPTVVETTNIQHPHQQDTSRPPAGHQLEPADLRIQILEERASAPRTRRVPSGPLQVVISHFQDRSESATGVPYDPSCAECANLARLVKKRGPNDAIARVNRLFDGRGPDWLQAPFTISTVVSNWNQLAVDSEPRAPRNGPANAVGIRPTTLL